ncbi:hypothetical protein IFM89_028894 [Coptis chinensis]|uniref:Uncharacterized protein n=1 Tax=Coptis chinensis TaxID=261450 RepID=A0A835H9L4_9MAGN|nr:hypothetical protein IFM89_028894 [Coptis chinensis]
MENNVSNSHPQEKKPSAPSTFIGEEKRFNENVPTFVNQDLLRFHEEGFITVQKEMNTEKSSYVGLWFFKGYLQWIDAWEEISGSKSDVTCPHVQS